MRDRWTLCQIIGCAAATTGCTLILASPATAQQQLLTDDLGHTNWEDMDQDYYIAADLVEHDGDRVVFDIVAKLTYSIFGLKATVRP